jgi:hypothetical protein
MRQGSWGVLFCAAVRGIMDSIAQGCPAKRGCFGPLLGKDSQKRDGNGKKVGFCLRLRGGDGTIPS